MNRFLTLDEQETVAGKAPEGSGKCLEVGEEEEFRAAKKNCFSKI